jgi:hypothetical protein
MSPQQHPQTPDRILKQQQFRKVLRYSARHGNRNLEMEYLFKKKKKKRQVAIIFQITIVQMNKKKTYHTSTSGNIKYQRKVMMLFNAGGVSSRFTAAGVDVTAGALLTVLVVGTLEPMTLEDGGGA